MTAATAATTDVLDTVEVLADPLRREIVRRLAEEELCTCHLVELSGAPQPTVSYHLKILRQAGWVHSERDGRYTYYRLDSTPIEALGDALLELAVQRPAGRRPGCN